MDDNVLGSKMARGGLGKLESLRLEPTQPVQAQRKTAPAVASMSSTPRQQVRELWGRWQSRVLCASPEEIHKVCSNIIALTADRLEYLQYEECFLSYRSSLKSYRSIWRLEYGPDALQGRGAWCMGVGGMTMAETGHR